MSQSPSSPGLAPTPPVQDFYELRREGIGHVEKLSSNSWTDYNAHDPGITVLEALSYALTELAYRTAFPLPDLLASAPTADPLKPYQDQAFFTAREILTVNPVTTDDFRRLLIDLESVRNAWLACRPCACETTYLVWCEHHQPAMSFNRQDAPAGATEIMPLGLYDVLLELEEDPELGVLNDRKVERRFDVVGDDAELHTVTMELRFPVWPADQAELLEAFVEEGSAFDLTVVKFSRSKAEGADQVDDTSLRRNWQGVFYATFEVEYPSGTKLRLENVSFRLFGDSPARRAATVAMVEAELRDTSSQGLVGAYRRKLMRTDEALEQAKTALGSHRNLAEDFCSVKGVAVEDIAVCASIEVSADADIERVQAEAWFAIEQYLSPPIPFFTLDELLADGVPVESIFNGPQVANGFVRDEDLERADLRNTVRTSDILNRLMDIPGINSINDVVLVGYDSDGLPIAGDADPDWVNGEPRFDPGRSGAEWLLFVRPQHQPRLNRHLSRFSFSKQGLPLLVREEEALAVLSQLHGVADRPKVKDARNDLPAPAGVNRGTGEYYPVQYGFPLVYGIGPAGLPSTATPLRRAQAKQLKAYLMVFEQLLANAFAQLEHTADLFSLDPGIQQTYFAGELGPGLIDGYDDLVHALDAQALREIVESPPDFQQRRNVFLDHLLARFGEQFQDHPLLLSEREGVSHSLDRLIGDKIGFLQQYPRVSRDRGKAFDYRTACVPGNVSGLQKRISLLLGSPDLAFSWQARPSDAPSGFEHVVLLSGGQEGTVSLAPSDEVATAVAALLTEKGLAGTPGWRLDYADGRLLLEQLSGAQDTLLSDLLAAGDAATAIALRDAIIANFRDVLMEPPEHLAEWSLSERTIVVEHVLLRPKFPGDAIYPVCGTRTCDCGTDDPYSFRLTFVMPGWRGPFASSMNLRAFAERTIRQETPAHLLPKVCWVGNSEFEIDPCDPLVDALGDVIRRVAQTSSGDPLNAEAVCECASALYTVFATVFAEWFAGRETGFHVADVLRAEIDALFAADVPPGSITCTAAFSDEQWQELRDLAVRYFTTIVLDGWQFGRFEAAWCNWLAANAGIDWSEAHLREAVEAVLRRNILDDPVPDLGLCRCADAILRAFGGDFHEWMETNVASGRAPDEFSAFSPSVVTLCAGHEFKPGTAEAITGLLAARYSEYVEVSYWLRVVLELLSGLRNIYPSANLHDCDDGDDGNPIRLGQTPLGSDLR